MRLAMPEAGDPVATPTHPEFFIQRACRGFPLPGATSRDRIGPVAANSHDRIFSSRNDAH